MIIILLLCLPTPYDLVDKLGSDSYAERRDTMLQLIKMEDEAVPALLEGLKSKDYEIRYDCDKLLDIYYTVSPSYDVAIPPIWSLSTVDRFDVTGFDVAKQYYLLAFKRGSIIQDYEWRDDRAEYLATRYYIYDRMVKGMKKQDAVKYLDQMVSNRGRYHYKKDASTNFPGMPTVKGTVRLDDGWQDYLFNP